MKKALLVIDVQNEYFTGKLKVTYPKNSLDNILKVMDYANKNNITIILIQHTGVAGDTFIKDSKESQMCCDTTAREAFHKGYNVEFLSDATGTIDVKNKVGSISSKELHKATLITQSLKFSNVISSTELIKKL